MSNVWCVKTQIDEQDHIVYDEILSGLDAGVDLSSENETWILSAYFDGETPKETILRAFETVQSITGKTTKLDIVSIPQADWKESLKQSFPALEIGSFFIHSFDEVVPEGMHSLRIPAGLAFGTGEHPTTAACLSLYEKLTYENIYENVLDMGCGSAILSMAAAKKQKSMCVAVDIDRDSVATACENIAINGCRDLITCEYSDGFSSNVVQSKAPYHLIFANILANPLIEMSDDLYKTLATGGTAILSGFTVQQRNSVVEAYQKLGAKVLEESMHENWVAVAIKKV